MLLWSRRSSNDRDSWARVSGTAGVPACYNRHGRAAGGTMEDDELTFGQWLQRRRKALHLTQQQLGTLVGCAAETIRKYEADSRRPAQDILDHLAAALQVPQREHGAFTRLAGGDLVDLPSTVPVT